MREPFGDVGPMAFGAGALRLDGKERRFTFQDLMNAAISSGVFPEALSSANTFA
jgi:hypothetical protein